MNAARLLRHLATSRHLVRLRFPASALAAIEAAVAAGEQRHEPEIRFAVEAALHPRGLFRGLTPRERALALFGELRVWDTEHNTGVLIYLLLADRAVEIVADRGVVRHVTPISGRRSVARSRRSCAQAATNRARSRGSAR